MSILKDVANTLEDRINESRRELREIARKYISEGGRLYDREKPAKESKPKDTFRAVNVTDSQHAQQYFEGLAAIFSEKRTGRDVSTPKYILGFWPLHVESKQEAYLTQSVQLAFHPEYLLIPSTIAEFFQIRDIKIGPYSQFIAASEVPASAFSENAPINRLKMDPCPISGKITIDVRNTDDRSHVFTAVIVGSPLGADMRDYVFVDSQSYYWGFSKDPNILTIYPVAGDVCSCRIMVSKNVFDLSKEDKESFICGCIKKHFKEVRSDEEAKARSGEAADLLQKSSGPIR